jgi:phospholipid/cholesterol/gamma-HCH transport system substrate-binding protein
VIRRSVKIQLVAFVVISLVGIAYVGFNYVGVNFTHKPYTVKLRLAQTGGIFTNAAVSERGVDVGRVGSMRLTKDREVEVDLKLKDGTKIPARGLRAVVAKLSAVGEQYVDLEPSTADGPYLRPGDVIPASATTVPLDDAEFLLNVDKLVSSVDTAHLTTVIEELGKSFDNLGPALQSLIDNGNSLTQSAIDSLPQQLQLIDDSKTVLDTQRDVASQLKQFASSFRSFSQQLVTSDPDLRGVLDNGITASKQLQSLLADNASALPTLLGNLITFNQIQQVRLPYVKAILQLLPPQVAGGFLVTPGDGTAHFGMINQTPEDNPQNPCVTGYASGQPNGFTPTRLRGNNSSSYWGGPANLDAYCKNDSANDQRGSRYLDSFRPDRSNVTNSDPYPGPVYGRSTHPTVSEQTQQAATTSASSSSSSGRTAAGAAPQQVIPLPYDPKTGVVTGTDGKAYQLGYSGPLAPIFGSNSWEWLLIAPTMR